MKTPFNQTFLLTVSIATSLSCSALATTAGALTFEERLEGVTTVVVSRYGAHTSFGTAFFFHRFEPETEVIEGPHWRTVESTWLVTNRHLLTFCIDAQGKRIDPPCNEGQEKPADAFTFHLRKAELDVRSWFPIRLTQEELLEKARFSEDQTVDLAVVDITQVLYERNRTDGPFVAWGGVNNEDIPLVEDAEVEVSDDVLVIGYPKGFYDQINLYPIVKAGIIASSWKVGFEGRPFFLIDAKLFPGSSGSLVISKPSRLRFKDGKILTSEAKKFYLLGVYAGETFKKRQVEKEGQVVVEKVEIEVGTVWHSRLIEELVEAGVAFAP